MLGTTTTSSRTLLRTSTAARAVARLHTLSSDVPVQTPANKSLFVERELANHRRQLKDARKVYLNDTLASQATARAEERAHAAEQRAAAERLQSDPMVVGTFKPRRELKRERLRNFGQFAPIPVGRTEPLPPATQGRGTRAAHPPPSPTNAHRLLKRVFARDLTPDNPRLAHLLHLWNASEHFVTARNVDDKIAAFFRDKATPPPSSLFPVTSTLHHMDGAQALPNEAKFLTTRLHQIMEFGVSNDDAIPAEQAFDAAQFATEDKTFAPATAGVHLDGGSVFEHVATRDLVVRDKLTDSLFGRPSVAKVLALGSSSSSTLSTSSSSSPADSTSQ
ncbi:hypothetical protein BC828DRAFT_77691 [Blastocladiella britannica]|nr:hypothetical protein BC828DRAFT_77691 [Blastocladiella britannica]